MKVKDTLEDLKDINVRGWKKKLFYDYDDTLGQIEWSKNYRGVRLGLVADKAKKSVNYFWYSNTKEGKTSTIERAAESISKEFNKLRDMKKKV